MEDRQCICPSMKRKQLEIILQDVTGFLSPKVWLEQYPTGAHLASCMMHTAASLGDVQDKCVIDLGCGTGVLSIAAALLGADHCFGIDIDDEALEVAMDNADQFDGDLSVDYIQGDVRRAVDFLYRHRPDTVVMNPPFGTKSVGADKEFLQTAFALFRHAHAQQKDCYSSHTSRGVIYSLHKSSTRKFIEKHVRELGCSMCRVVAEMKYDLPRMYKFHKKDSVDIAVDFWCGFIICFTCTLLYFIAFFFICILNKQTHKCSTRTPS